MNKKIKSIENYIYNFSIGFWTPFSFLLSMAFAIDDNDGIGIYLTILTIIIYIFLLIPNNIIFFKQTKTKKEKIILTSSFIIGILLSLLLYKGNGVLNIVLMGTLIITNIIFLSLNKKSDNIYISLLFILNIIYIYTNIDCFNIF